MEPVVVRSNGTFLNTVDAHGHQFAMDEPASAGGSDGGPTPYELLSAALGGCTSMTLHFVARRDAIPLTGIEVRVTNDRIHAKDCADCESANGYIHRFDVHIRLEGDLTAEQREKLFSTARRCPVYKTLTSEIRIVEELD